MATGFMPRMINQEEVNYEFVLQIAENHRLGEIGFPAATRLIIREWEQMEEYEIYFATTIMAVN